MPAKAKTKTLDEYAAELKADGFRVQRDAYGTVTAYERGDRPADTTGALTVDENGNVASITTHSGEAIAASAKQVGDHTDTVARVDDVPVVIVDGKLHKHHGPDEDGEPILEAVG